jgi:predicted PurR-regulated permease PerM
MKLFRKKQVKETEAPPASENERLARAIEKLNVHLDKRELENYLELLQHPKKLIWVNLISGLSRGIGMTLGIGSVGIMVGVVLAALLTFLGYLPFVGEIFKSLTSDLLHYVQQHK